MSKASEEILSQLHNLTAESFRAEIERLKTAGEGIPPSLLAAAARFLKDNGIDSPARTGSPVDLLKDEMPETFDNNFPN